MVVVRVSQQGVTMGRLAIGALEYARRKRDSKFLSRFHRLDMTWVYNTTVKSLFIEFIKKVSSMKHCEKLWKQSPTERLNCSLCLLSGSSCWTHLSGLMEEGKWYLIASFSIIVDHFQIIVDLNGVYCRAGLKIIDSHFLEPIYRFFLGGGGGGGGGVSFLSIFSY